MSRWWVARGNSGRLVNTFREHGVVAAGTSGPPCDLSACGTREEIAAALNAASAGWGDNPGHASQFARFVIEMEPGHRVATPTTKGHELIIGIVNGPYAPLRDHPSVGLHHHRRVAWRTQKTTPDHVRQWMRHRRETTFEITDETITAALEALLTRTA